MPRFLLAVLAVLLLSSFALAQPKTSFEIFGGYSYINGDFTGVTHEASPGITLQGWNASVNVKSGSWFGVVADFAGYYPSHDFGGGFTSSAKAHTFLFGPQVSLPVKRIKPFAHFLLGETYVVGSQTFLTTSDHSLTYAVGGGLDFALTDRIALRAQFDSLHNGFTTNDNQVQFVIDRRVVRISTGVVFRF
jgi:opacity protein-like surface antigen